MKRKPVNRGMMIAWVGGIGRFFARFWVVGCLVGCGDSTGGEKSDSRPASVESPAQSPSDPVSVFRKAMEKGRMGEAREALTGVDDLEYRSLLTGQFHTELGARIRQMAQENPEDTLGDILEGVDGMEVFWLEVVMGEYLLIDREAAMKWHEECRSELTEEQNDRIFLAVARDFLAIGNWSSAKKLREEVVDPELKKVIGDEIGAVMEEEVRRGVRESGDEAMGMLLRGDRGFEVFWIEVAMNEFMKVDSRGAGEWYVENVAGLSSDQHDRVALAFARAAMGVGDSELALEWAWKIQEEELREVALGEVGE